MKRTRRVMRAEEELVTEGNRQETRQLVLGIDIGGTKTGVLVWDAASDSVLVQDTLPTPTEVGPDALVERILVASHDLLAGCNRDSSDLRAAGVAVPGLVDPAAGTVLTAGNLSEWVDVPLRDLIAAQLQVPVAIEHDAAAAALGERWQGAARDLQHFAFLALGTGIGVGIVIQGQLYRGAHNAVGELGDLVVGRQFLGQPRDGQGNLAELIGGKSLRRRARQATGAKLSAAEALVYAEEDAELAVMADEVADYLAMAVIAISALLDPEAIIVGGGTAEAGTDLLDPVRERVAREVVTPPILVASALGSEAQLYGAVFAALREVELEAGPPA